MRYHCAEICNFEFEINRKNAIFAEICTFEFEFKRRCKMGYFLCWSLQFRIWNQTQKMRFLLKFALSDLNSDARIVIFAETCNFEFESKREKWSKNAICSFEFEFKSNAKIVIFVDICNFEFHEIKRENCDFCWHLQFWISWNQTRNLWFFFWKLQLRIGNQTRKMRLLLN